MQNAQQSPFGTQSGFSSLTGTQRDKRWDADVPWFDIPENRWVQLRFMGPTYAISQHWFQTKSKKRFALVCPAYDSVTRRYDHKDKCAVETLIDTKNTEIQELKALGPRQTIFQHAIVRELQQKGEISYVRPLRLPITLALSIANLKGMNQHIDPATGIQYDVDVTDENYGADIMVFNNPNAQNPTQKYQVQFYQKNALNENEKSQLTRLHDWASLIKYPTYQEILTALERNDYMALINGNNGTAPQAYDNAFAPAPPPPPMIGNQQQFAPPPPPPMQMQTTQFAPPPPPPVQTQQFAPPPPPPMQAQFAAPQVQQQTQQFAPPPPMAPPPAFAPQTAMQQPAAQAAPVSQQAPVAAVQGGAGPKFQVSGRQEPVGLEEFQSLVTGYGAAIPRSQPLKLWNKDDLNGVQVLQCFAQYQGDSSCLKCPLRRWCIQY
jgi:hypothetical protein